MVSAERGVPFVVDVSGTINESERRLVEETVLKHAQNIQRFSGSTGIKIHAKSGSTEGQKHLCRLDMQLMDDQPDFAVHREGWDLSVMTDQLCQDLVTRLKKRKEKGVDQRRHP